MEVIICDLFHKLICTDVNYFLQRKSPLFTVVCLPHWSFLWMENTPTPKDILGHISAGRVLDVRAAVLPHDRAPGPRPAGGLGAAGPDHTGISGRRWPPAHPPSAGGVCSVEVA